MAEMGAKLRPRCAPLRRLRMENARMQHQQDVMERVLQVRDSAVSMLEAGKVGAAGHAQRGWEQGG